MSSSLSVLNNPTLNNPTLNQRGYTKAPRIGSHVCFYQNPKLTVESYPVPVQLCLPSQLPTSQAYQPPQNYFFVHSRVTINLGVIDPTHRSYLRLASELQALRDCDCATVVHIGRRADAQLSNVAEAIDQLDNEGIIRAHPQRYNRFPLLLENAAGQGNELGFSWDDLRLLRESIDSSAIGFCFDTQHAFAAGLSDFSTDSTIDNIFNWGEYLSPGYNWGLIHLNDSAKPFNSRVDRHAPLGTGYIWSQMGTSANPQLFHLVERAMEVGIDMVTETSDPQQDFRKLYEVCSEKLVLT